MFCNESTVHFFKKPIPFETFSLEIEHQKYVQANILNYARLELTYSDIYKCMQPNMPEVDIYKHRDTERNTHFHFSNSVSILWTFKKHRKNCECCPYGQSLTLTVFVFVFVF